jgi:hypothetical protein
LSFESSFHAFFWYSAVSPNDVSPLGETSLGETLFFVFRGNVIRGNVVRGKDVVPFFYIIATLIYIFEQLHVQKQTDLSQPERWPPFTKHVLETFHWQNDLA